MAKLHTPPDNTVNPDTLDTIRRRGGKWAAYVNIAGDSANLGHVQFLKYGPGCTYEAPPEKYPADTTAGLGWRYFQCGFVDLHAGLIVDKETS